MHELALEPPAADQVDIDASQWPPLSYARKLLPALPDEQLLEWLLLYDLDSNSMAAFLRQLTRKTGGIDRVARLLQLAHARFGAISATAAFVQPLELQTSVPVGMLAKSSATASSPRVAATMPGSKGDAWLSRWLLRGPLRQLQGLPSWRQVVPETLAEKQARLQDPEERRQLSQVYNFNGAPICTPSLQPPNAQRYRYSLAPCTSS